jgi:hypothetical protein
MPDCTKIAEEPILAEHRRREWAPTSYVARALRGQGIQLIDLRRLDEAEAVLKQSLEFEPETKARETSWNISRASAASAKPRKKRFRGFFTPSSTLRRIR